MHLFNSGRKLDYAALYSQNFSVPQQFPRADTALDVLLQNSSNNKKMAKSKLQKKSSSVNKLEQLIQVATSIESFHLTLLRMANVVKYNSTVKHLAGLGFHTWVMIRGIHAAAEGFSSPKKTSSADRSKAAAGVMSKLWYDEDVLSQLEDGSSENVKPFPAMMASVVLQISKVRRANYLTPCT